MKHLIATFILLASFSLIMLGCGNDKDVDVLTENNSRICCLDSNTQRQSSCKYIQGNVATQYQNGGSQLERESKYNTKKYTDIMECCIKANIGQKFINIRQ